MHKVPTAEEILASPCAHRQLKAALRIFLDADPVDAANDAALLAAVLKAHAQEIVEAGGAS